jgi:sec-independent protein translocase protein TatB
MFDFAWSEIALIGIVALIAIGPKDMPVAIKAVSEMVKKARRMAGEFQTHVDDMMRDADLAEVRNSINEIRRFDLKGAVERHVDPDGSLRDTFARSPFDPTPIVPETTTTAAEAVTATETVTDASLIEPEPASPFIPDATETVPTHTLAPEPDAPAFIPPSLVAVTDAPAFVPPGTRRGSEPKPRF